MRLYLFLPETLLYLFLLLSLVWRFFVFVVKSTRHVVFFSVPGIFATDVSLLFEEIYPKSSEKKKGNCAVFHQDAPKIKEIQSTTGRADVVFYANWVFRVSKFKTGALFARPQRVKSFTTKRKDAHFRRSFCPCQNNVEVFPLFSCQKWTRRVMLDEQNITA